LEGVDIVTRRVTDAQFDVLSSRGRATVRVQRAAGVTRFAYEQTTGDPLALDTTLARMRREGQLTADGFADAEQWLRATAAAPYPAAVVRIVHGHLDATRNPAPILVSLDDRYRVGLGFVSVTNRLRPLGGTHGALSSTNAVGIVMTNFQDTPDALATTVRRQFGEFDDLLEPKAARSSVRIATPAMLQGNRFATARWAATRMLPADTTPLLVLRLSDGVRPLATDSLWLQVTVRQQRGDRLIAVTALPAGHWMASADGSEWAIAARDVRVVDLTPGEVYTVQVRADGSTPRADGSRSRWARTLVETPLRAARDGLPWTF
jgi:hypothetical protein